MNPPSDAPCIPEPTMPDPLQEIIVTLLLPLLPKADQARDAAGQAIAACRAQGQENLVSIAQIVGFALTALDNLRLSMPEDLSLSMKLKLRGNANALGRSSQRAAVTKARHQASAPPTSPGATAPTAGRSRSPA